MRDVTGILCLLIAAWFAYAAFQRRRQFQERASQGLEPPPLHESLRMMADLGPGIVQLFTVVAGLQLVLAFVVSDGAGIFSLVDLAGFLVLLGAYAAWVTVKSRFRV